MKLLFAIQGTGNGHISRAREVLPVLRKYAHVDVLISGHQVEIGLDQRIAYRHHGLGFVFGQQGGVNVFASLKQFKPIRALNDALELPIRAYDAVVNDFEPLSAYAARWRNIPVVALSHQAAFLSDQSPRPNNSKRFPEWVLKHYAPSDAAIGIHFQPYDTFIHTPVIRREVRNLDPVSNDHITVYLPAYADETLIDCFHHWPEIRFELFSKSTSTAYAQKNVVVSPIRNGGFLRSLAASNGLITGGGFESPAEAMYLGKKLFCIPMTNQYEQLCNATALRQMGVTVAPRLNAEAFPMLNRWLEAGKPVPVDFPHHTEQLVQAVFERISWLKSGNRMPYPALG